MAETLITRTFAEGLRPLGSAAQRNHALVTHTLAARLSPAHALLFCEPSPTPDGVATDWYAQATGSVRRLDELEAAEGEAVRARLGGLTADILQLADAIEASDRNLAEALRHAVEVPTAGAIWVVGDQPVLVTWAHSREVDKAPLGIVRQFLPRRPPQSAAALTSAPAVAEVREPRTFRDVLWWCGWLLLAALLAWAFWLLVAPCALRLPGTSVLDLCPRSLAPAVRAEEDRRSALEDRVAMLERELALGGGCVALPPPPQQTAGLEPPPEPSDPSQTVVEEGGAIGAVNVILSWSGKADLDLHVTCPTGEEIFHGDREGCGGELDVDANANAHTAMASPVENIVFPERPEAGRYRVEVKFYSLRGEPRDSRIPFTLTIIVEGEETVHQGVVAKNENEEVWATRFTL